MQKELRNEMRKRSRLRARAKALSDTDLLQVWSLRQDAAKKRRPSEGAGAPPELLPVEGTDAV